MCKRGPPEAGSGQRKSPAALFRFPLRISRFSIPCMALLALAATQVVAGEELGDPTRPTALVEPLSAPAVGAPASAGPRWHLGSTVVSEARQIAVINGRTLRRGDRIEKATLLEIFKDRVVLDYEGRRMTVRLRPETVQVKR